MLLAAYSHHGPSLFTSCGSLNVRRLPSLSLLSRFVQGAAKIRTSCQWSPGAGDEVHINSTSNFCKELGYCEFACISNHAFLSSSESSLFLITRRNLSPSSILSLHSFPDALNIPWEDLLWLLNAFNFVLKPISTSSSASVYHVNSVPQYILFHPTNGFRKDSTPIELCQIQIQKHKLVELESIGKEYLEDEKKMKETIQPILQPLPIPRSNSVAMDKGNSSGGRGRKEQAIRSIARDSVARDSIASTSGSEDGLKRKNAGDDDDDSPATKRRGRPPKAEGERKSSRSSASLVDYKEPGDREGLSWAELYAPEGYQPIIPVPTAETLATPSWRKPPPPTLPPKTKEEMETIPIPPWLDPTPRPTNAKPTNGTKSKASTSKASTSKSNQSRPISQSLNKGGKSDGTVISPASAAYKTAKLESPRCLSCKGKHQKCLPGKGGVVNGIKVGPCEYKDSSSNFEGSIVFSLVSNKPNLTLRFLFPIF